MADWLGEQGVELVVCAGYMQLLTPAFLERYTAINVHPSLLPAFPGTTPIEDALAAGVGRDRRHGPLRGRGRRHRPGDLRRSPCPIEPGRHGRDASASAIHEVEHRLLPEAARLYLAGALRS